MRKFSTDQIREATRRSMTKKAVAASDLLRFVPVVGGGLHGLVSPEEMSSRGESMLFEGAGGALGGIGGLIGGAMIADALMNRYEMSDPNAEMLRRAALGGSSLGTAIGTIPGRFLVRRKTAPRKAELDEIMRELERLQVIRSDGGSPVILNIGQGASVNPSTGAPLEADEESGDDKDETKEK